MRKADIEMLEVRLEPLQIARDRHESTINDLVRQLKDLANRMDAVERDRTSFALTMDQAANSVRSLLTQANRKLRDARMLVDTDEPLTEIPPETNTVASAPAPLPQHRGRRVI